MSWRSNSLVTDSGTYSRLRFDVEASIFPGVVDERITLVSEGDTHVRCESQAGRIFDVIPRLKNNKINVMRRWRQGDDD